MSPIEFLIFGLATFRATRLLNRDTIFNTPRDLLWNRYPPHASSIGYVFTCDWCMSIWVGSLFAIWSIISPRTFGFLGLVLAASAVVGLLAAYEDR